MNTGKEVRMRNRGKWFGRGACGALGVILGVSSGALGQQLPPDGRVFPNATGQYATFSGQSPTGQIDLTHPFFQPVGLPFGGNERSCGSCHRPEQAWSVTPAKLNILFNETAGLDPIFLPLDGTNAPNMPRNTVAARRLASSLVLSKGLFRVERKVLPSFEFELVAVRVPNNGSFPADFTTNAVANQIVSVFRRPPSIANAAYLTDLMWDGRNTTPDETMETRMLGQALSAVRGHMNAAALPVTVGALGPAELQLMQDLVDFQRNVFGAQGQDIGDLAAGVLDSAGAFGGPLTLMTQPPDVFGAGTFNFYTAWRDLSANPFDPDFYQMLAKASIARGEQIFNTRTFATGMIGTATCSTCHNVTGTGNSAKESRFDLGLSAATTILSGELVNADLPVYTLRRKSNGATINTTDPGRILVTGTWGTNDGNAFKVPMLRGLAARAPYFHGGQAKDLATVVNFYDRRFQIRLSAQERADLVAFLRSL